MPRLYPSAMSDENSIYAKTETGYAYSTVMNDECAESSIVVNLIKEVLIIIQKI